MTSGKEKYLEILRNEVPAFENVGTNYKYESKIYLTPLSMSGLEGMHEYSVVPEFFRYIDVDPSSTIQDTRNYISKLLDRMEAGYKGGHAMYWFLHLRENDKIIGTFCLVGVDFENKMAEAGKGLSTFHLGKGYMFEAQWIVLNYAFNRLDLNSISSFTNSDNAPNIQLMKTAGFRERERENVTYRDGSIHEMLTMKIDLEQATLDRCLALAKIAQ